MHWLTDPFAFAFMQRSLAGAILVGIACAPLGVYVVHRRMAFIGDALAHAALPGIAVAFLMGASLFAGAVAAAGAAAIGIAWASRRGMVREDSAIGIVFTTMFAAGVALMSGARTYRSLNDVLLGSLLAIGPGDLLPLAAVAVIVVAALALLHKELELSSADPEYARAIGIREDRLRLALLLLLALAVVSGIHAVGVVLTSALLVTPAAAASLLTRRLFPMMLAATGIAVASSAAGLLLSWHAKIPCGAAVVLAASTAFAAAAVVKRVRQGSAAA